MIHHPSMPPPDPQWTGIYDAQVVVATDPSGKGRVRLLVPQVLGNTHSHWAVPMQPGLNPAVGDTVYCHFLGGNPDLPQFFLGINSTDIQSIISSSTVLNSNPLFTGGVTAPWKAIQANLTPVTPNADTNPPYPDGVLLTATTTQGMSLQDQNFTVIPGQPYQVSSWVFYPAGGTAFAGMGFNDHSNNPITGNFTQTMTVAANTWTYLSNVVLAPSNAASGTPVIGTNDTTLVGTQFTVEAAQAVGQIPGQLIAPGSIGTTQVGFSASDIGGITTSIQATAPNNPNTGDLWFNTSQDGVLEQWTGTVWQQYQYGSGAIKAGSIVAGLIAAGAIDGTVINGVTINGNTINAADLIISATNGGVFCYSAPPATVVTLTSGTSWQAPTGVTGNITVEAWAGGGGGGFTSGNNGGGGGGGEYAKDTAVPVTAGNSYTYAIGGGGSAGSSGGGGGGGATVVQTTTATINGTTAPANITATFSSNTTAGNCILAFWLCEGGAGTHNSTVSSVTLGGSADHWGQVTGNDPDIPTPNVEIWADPNCVGGQTSVQVNATGGSGTVWYDLLIMEVSGLLNTNSVATLTDQVASNFNSTGSTSFSSGATNTTTQANDFAIGVAGSWGNGVTLTGPGSWTNLTTFGIQPMKVGYKSLASTQSVTYSGTVGAAHQWTALVATLKCSAGGSGNATAGGNTTFTGDSSHTVTAHGGGAASSSQAGAGGTGSSAPTHHNGGPGGAGSNTTVQGNRTFTTVGNNTWQAPSGVTTVKAQVWGAGGGGNGITQHGAYGGGGGGFAQGNAVAVTPLSNYTAHVGAGGASGGPTFPDGSTAGGNSTFQGDSVTITGNGGHSGGPGDGAGGSGSGDVVHGGGSGGRVTTNAPGYGGGGGGSGGPDGGGGSGTNGTASVQGRGGTADGGGVNGGNGGNGGLEPGNGASGGTPGGGGGSAGYTPSNEFGDGGGGANGQVKLTWSGTTNVGGGGGSSAGTNGNGVAGSAEQGGAAVTGGGPGGGILSGGTWTATPASGPGGGGGGNDPNGSAGTGAAGQIKLSYGAGTPALLFSICGAAQNDPISGVACPEGPYLLQDNPFFFQGTAGENTHGQIATPAARQLQLQSPMTASNDNQATVLLKSNATGTNAKTSVTGDFSVSQNSTLSGTLTVSGNIIGNNTTTGSLTLGGDLTIPSTHSLLMSDSGDTATMNTNQGYQGYTNSLDSITYNFGRRIYALATTQTVNSGTYSNVLSWTPGPVTTIPVKAISYYIKILIMVNISGSTAYAMKPVMTGSTSYALWYVEGSNVPGNLTTDELFLEQPLTSMNTGVGSSSGFGGTAQAFFEGFVKFSSTGNFSLQCAVNAGVSYTCQQGSFMIIEPVPDI